MLFFTSTLMNLPQKDLMSWRLQNRGCKDSHSFTEATYTKHSRFACVWRRCNNKLWLCVTAQTNLKTKQEIQFLLFHSWSSPVDTQLNNYQPLLSLKHFQTYALEIWVWGLLRCLGNIGPTTFWHFYFIFYPSFAFFCISFYVDEDLLVIGQFN